MSDLNFENCISECVAGDKIAVSDCLIGTNCKYNGGNNANPQLMKWLEDKDVIPICPEVLGGLPTPRFPAEIVNGIVTNNQGQSVHEAFVRGAELALAQIQSANPRLVILQSRSPSCGVKQIYDGSFQGKLIDGRGIFAEMAVKQGYTVVDVEVFNKYFSN